MSQSSTTLSLLPAGVLLFREDMLGNMPSRYPTEEQLISAQRACGQDPHDLDKAWALEAIRLRMRHPHLEIDEDWAETVRDAALARLALTTLTHELGWDHLDATRPGFQGR